jgi:hypothetical protein
MQPSSSGTKGVGFRIGSVMTQVTRKADAETKGRHKEMELDQANRNGGQENRLSKEHIKFFVIRRKWNCKDGPFKDHNIVFRKKSGTV